MRIIPVNEPVIGEREKELVLDCLNTGWVSSDGPYVKEFEDKFSSYVGSKYGITVCNGTAALEAAFYGINLVAGDEVIMPSFTIISCAVAVMRLGGVPKFVDVDPDTWCIDVIQLKAAITKKTKAVLVVHMYGHPAPIDEIKEQIRGKNIFLVEDASQVHGACYKGKLCGNLGDVSTFSFYANKLITTGEGGMVVTSNESIADRVKAYRNLCFDVERRYIHDDMGFNYRLTNVQAAIGIAQLERIDEIVKRKRDMGYRYINGLKNIPGVKTQIERDYAFSVFWMYGLVLDREYYPDAVQVIGELKKHGIGARHFFHGLHNQPMIVDRGFGMDDASFPVTNAISSMGLYLPSGLTLSNDDIDYVIEKLGEILKNNRKGNYEQ